MKRGKYVAVLLTLSLLVACAPMDHRTSAQDGSDLDHNVLAKQYEDLAKDMQAKVQEQKEIFKHKPRSSYFGKRGKDVKSNIAYKIRKYEKAEQEYLDKAAYHRKISTNINQANKKNKASKKLSNNNSSL